MSVDSTRTYPDQSRPSDVDDPLIVVQGTCKNCGWIIEDGNPSYIGWKAARHESGRNHSVAINVEGGMI